MKRKKLIPDKEEYTIERVREEGLGRFFSDFQANFMNFTSVCLEFGRRVVDLVDKVDKGDGYKLLRMCLAQENSTEFPNYNRYIRDLERACNAAQSLGNEYDIGIGIAKKGTWLSYVFKLHDYKTRDLIVVRIGDERIVHTLSPLVRGDVRGKRVLLMENDLITGESVKAVSESLLSRGADKVDLLLIYGYTRPSKQFYDHIKAKFKGKPKKFGETVSGEIVLDTRCEVPNTINRTLALDIDFQAGRRYLDFLIEKLYGGKYE